MKDLSQLLVHMLDNREVNVTSTGVSSESTPWRSNPLGRARLVVQSVMHRTHQDLEHRVHAKVGRVVRVERRGVHHILGELRERL